MSNYKTNKNITFIDDLPYLDQLENKPSMINMIPPDKTQIIRKFIRNNNYDPPFESGMMVQQQALPPQNFNDDDYIQQKTYQKHNNNFDEEKSYDHPPTPPLPPIKNYYQELSCISVAEHTANCVVCSRLYENNNTIYIVTIILLSIICILLLKRVLNV